MWKEAVRRKRMDGNHSLREGGCQCERGRMPAQEGGCQRKRGRMPAREGEDASHSSREGGCHSLREGGGHCALWWEGRTMNFRLVGKFKVQQCRNFKFSGLEVVHIQKILGIDVCV